MRSAPITLALPPDVVEAIAEQLAPRIAAELAGQVSTSELREEEWRVLPLPEAARRLNRSERWVREHKTAIGYVKLDDGALGFLLKDLVTFAESRRVPLLDDATLEPRSRLRAVGLEQ